MSGFSGNVDEPGDDHAGHGMLLLGAGARRDPTRAIFTLILGAIGLVTGLTGTLVAVLYCSIFSLMFSFVGLSALLGL